jgi:ABC-type branched-subunit amino acid transport system ATPase component
MDSVAPVTAAPDVTTTNAIEVAGLTLRIQGLTVLDSVDFSVPAGMIYGVVGPNGAGKTSLLNCLTRSYPATSGHIAVYGRSLQGLRPHHVAALGVARTFQNVGAFREMKALDVVRLGRHVQARGRLLQHLCGYAHMRGWERDERDRALAALDFVGLAGLATRRMEELSYGAAKLVDLARTLVAEPRVLLLDEPTSGLTDAERDRVAELLEQIGRMRAVTQVIIEHNMSVTVRLCERLLALVSGRQAAEGATASVLSNPAVLDAFLGTAEASATDSPEDA